MDIQKPIFIIGSIRSGTTILYGLLSVHPEVCWFSNHTNRYPDFSGLAAIQRMLDIPFLGARMKRAIISKKPIPPRLNVVPWPDEGDHIYHSYCGFGKIKNGIENALSEEMEGRLKEKIREHMRFSGKRRFLSKQTANNRRLELLNRMFPDAFYIHSIRDGRAVASSTLQVPWWKDTHIWWLGYKASEWETTGRDPIELCALYWKRTVLEIMRNRYLFGDRYMEVRYEELTRDVKGMLSKIVHFCELSNPSEFMDLLPEALPNRNYKWKEQLTESQKSTLSESIGEFLKTLGYSQG